MIITATNRRWNDLTAREKTLLAVRRIVQFALLAAPLLTWTETLIILSSLPRIASIRFYRREYVGG
jgi:hypothetical protein